MVVPKNIEDSSKDTRETRNNNKKRNNNTSAVIQTDLKETSKKWTEKKKMGKV